MTPTLVFKDGKPVIATGSPGGSTIITVVLQQLLNVLDFNMNLAEATAAPRIHHQWLPDRVWLEEGISPDTELLAWAAGWDIGRALIWTVPLAGAAQMVMVWRAAAKAGLRLWPRWPRLTPELKRLAVIAAPTILGNQSGKGRLARVGAVVHSVMLQVRRGLTVFRHPRNGAPAVALQLFAWVIQMLSCWALMFALGLDSQAGLAASAAVLLAVNVTAVVPVTPSNIGMFQVAVIFVLHKGWGISTADALAYGVILQAVEMATAVALGVPAMLRRKGFTVTRQ